MEKTAWYISFADEKFLGGVIVMADSMENALSQATTMGINPGGEAQGIPYMGTGTIHEQYMNRLLSKEDIQAMDKMMNEEKGEGE